MQKRDLGLLATGAAIAAALFGVYQWRTAASSGPEAAPATTATSGAASMQGAAPGMPAAPGAAANAAGANAGTAAAPAVPSVADSTAKLAARLQKSGGSAADWQLLGKSYDFLGMKPEADAAYARGGGRPPGAAPAGSTGSTGTAGTASPAAAGAVAAAARPRLAGTVDVAPRLRAGLPANAVLFVLAKSAVLSGPPLAVIRLPVTDWPVRFVLDDSNAMMPAMNLSSAEKVTVEARISVSGNPLAQPGDLSGSLANIDPRRTKPLRIVIDHAVQNAR